MAGTKGQKSREEKPKKRKRDQNEADQKSKRHRKEPEIKAAGQGQEMSGDIGDAQLSLHPEDRTEINGLAHQSSTSLEQVDDGESGWKISKPMGGRMLDIDPIVTNDEQNLIVAYNTSIQVYSTADSLLIRRIPISSIDTPKSRASTPATIVATALSRRNPEFVWVATSNGRVFLVNWTQSSDAPEIFRTSSGTARDLSVFPIGSGREIREVVILVESDKASRLDVVAYQIEQGTTLEARKILGLKKNGQGLQLLKASSDGSVLVGAFNDRLFIGAAVQGALETFDNLQYDFFSFDTPDIITALDIKVTHKNYMNGSSVKKKALDCEALVDILVGGARGAIHLYHDALTRTRASGKSKSEKDTLQAQRYHWHRRAVHSVKWSRDGNYMISGGSENTLVMWQLDTSKKDFLPHLAASVENIVVSPNGSSYAVHLDDNSVMVLSTSEMKPTAYISGIQSVAANISQPKDLLVRRLWTGAESVRRPIPAAIRSTDPSQLHLCVGNGRQATMSGEFSAPWLQSFDIESFTSVHKQPLARTQLTDVNLTSKGVPIEEPHVTHMSFSSDGKWLASIDVWNPPERDMDNVTNDLRDQLVRERQEAYLKFWELRPGESAAALVSRINTPHSTNQPEGVLDLAADPTSSCFATIGSDGMVRVWRPNLRQQNGIAAKGSEGQEIYTWGCSQVIPVGDGLGQEAGMDLVHEVRIAQPQGSVAFSEDGSTIFAAFGAVDTGVVYVIDAASGEVVKALENLWTGKLRSIRTLSPFVLVLSDELRVYDVVGDELRYGIDMPCDEKEADLLQLAVDYTSRHFAVSIPMLGISSIGVFDPEESEPLLVRTLPHKVASLVSTPKRSGFVVLDDAAQVWTVTEGSDPSSLASMQPLVDLNLDTQSTVQLNGHRDHAIVEDTAMASDDEDDRGPSRQADDDVEMDEDDNDEDFYASVVAQQHLAEIFDAAPAFAAPSVEEMFYKVTNLLGAKPLLTASE